MHSARVHLVVLDAAQVPLDDFAERLYVAGAQLLWEVSKEGAVDDEARSGARGREGVFNTDLGLDDLERGADPLQRKPGAPQGGQEHALGETDEGDACSPEPRVALRRSARKRR